MRKFLQTWAREACIVLVEEFVRHTSHEWRKNAFQFLEEDTRWALFLALFPKGNLHEILIACDEQRT